MWNFSVFKFIKLKVSSLLFIIIITIIVKFMYNNILSENNLVLFTAVNHGDPLSCESDWTPSSVWYARQWCPSSSTSGPHLGMSRCLQRGRTQTAFTFILPVIQQIGFISRDILDLNKVIPEGYKDAQTPHTFSPSFTWVPKPMSCSFFFSFPLAGAISARHHQTPIPESNCRFLYSVLDMHYYFCSSKLAVFNLLQSAQGTISFSSTLSMVSCFLLSWIHIRSVNLQPNLYLSSR